MTMIAYSGPQATQAFTLSPCPICETPGAPGEEFCVECGFLVGSTPGEILEADRPLARFVGAAGREFALRAGENIVGREGADVLLPDRTVSRRHARVVVEENSVWLEDMGSTNGTRVRDAILPAGQRTGLSDKSPVQFGAVKLTLRVPEGAIVERLALPAPDAPMSVPLALPSSKAVPEGASVTRVSTGKKQVLSALSITFGRKEGNTIVIDDDAFVSGRHAEVFYQDGAFHVRDLGSTNGTKHNGVPLTPNAPMALHEGDEIAIGKTNFRYQAPA